MKKIKERAARDLFSAGLQLDLVISRLDDILMDLEEGKRDQEHSDTFKIRDAVSAAKYLVDRTIREWGRK